MAERGGASTPMADDRRFRILVEPSDYRLQNMGDVAMFEVAVRRLAALWPTAAIEVLTATPEVLRADFPGAKPVPQAGRLSWLPAPTSPAGAGIAGRIRRSLDALTRNARRRWPGLLRVARQLTGRRTAREEIEFLDAVRSADLLLVTGMGGVTDAFPAYAVEVLETLRLAMRHGATTAMVGQGFGPLENPSLRALARSVLPRIDLIALRESGASGPLLRSLGVADDRVLTTGDDAIELAYESRSEPPGEDLGVNVRHARYAAVDDDLLTRLREVLHDAARAAGAPLRPVPISRVGGEEDAETIRRLMEGYGEASDGGAGLVTPRQVIEQVRSCRVVVAGSYHAAVFALAQGIPAIGLARSPYYLAKFLGLADQFGEGCRVVDLLDASWPSCLRESIDLAWQTADAVRPGLLAAARRQIEQSRDAYRRIFDLTVSRSR